jgi:hypothetical protein
MFLQVECRCCEINSLSFLSKKERRQFEHEKRRVEEHLERRHLEQHSSSTGQHSDPEIDLPRNPSAYAQVLRQFSPEVADEYERVQELHRNRSNLSPYAIHPRDGSRVTLDYHYPPFMEGCSPNEPVEYVVSEGRTVQLFESQQSNGGIYHVRLTAAMRDELLRRELAWIDEPNEEMYHDNYRFIACRMCPRCFKGPLNEDEVRVLIMCMRSLRRVFLIVACLFLAFS